MTDRRRKRRLHPTVFDQALRNDIDKFFAKEELNQEISDAMLQVNSGIHEVICNYCGEWVPISSCSQEGEPVKFMCGDCYPINN